MAKVVYFCSISSKIERDLMIKFLQWQHQSVVVEIVEQEIGDHLRKSNSSQPYIVKDGSYLRGFHDLYKHYRENGYFYC